MTFWRKKQQAPEAQQPQGPQIPRSRVRNAFGLDASTKSDAQRYVDAMARAFPRSHEGLKEFGIAMDADIKVAMDSNIQSVKALVSQNQGFLPMHVLEWYSDQSFLGWQVCAILAQNWLVNKACAMPGRDAVRHGFERSVNKDVEVPSEAFDELRRFDKHFRLKENLMEHHHFARVFGLRHTLFLVDGIDYEAPFNIDGVGKSAYKGMTQVDPYWLAPMFSAEDAADPYSQHFYDPTWWMVNGRKVHRSHFVISRNGSELADILKPTYFYGGLSTAQLIYSRVYSSERTANEAPLLAMTKRLLTLTTDTTKAMADLPGFRAKLTDWLALLNNFGCKVVGADEKLEQIDTSLSGLDETIMTQYQLVAAAADVPATKLLGTSPKGFGASGDYEIASYHEFLESVQENELTPIVDRHTALVQRSEGICPDVNMETQWLPVAALTAKEQAEVNAAKAQTDQAYIASGVVLGEEVRRKIAADRDSGYNGLADDIEIPGPGDDAGEPEGGGDSDDDASVENDAAQDVAFDDISGWNSRLGQYDGARIITHQKFLDEDIVQQKMAEKDFTVNVTPEFEKDGKKYRMVIDGHHSLAAAMRAGAVPVFTEELPREELINAATRQATDKRDA